MPRIQFTVSNQELADLQRQAAAAGCTVPELCYEKSVPDNNTSAMYKQLIDRVNKRTSGDPFVLRELFPGRRIPTVLGRRFARAVHAGGVKGVEALGRDEKKKADAYRKTTVTVTK